MRAPVTVHEGESLEETPTKVSSLTGKHAGADYCFEEVSVGHFYDHLCEALVCKDPKEGDNARRLQTSRQIGGHFQLFRSVFLEELATCVFCVFGTRCLSHSTA